MTINVDGGLQPSVSGFSDSIELRHPTFGFETGDVTTRYRGGTGSVFDVGLRVHVAGNLALGAGVFLYSPEGTASLVAALPHPFLFERPRRAFRTVTGLDRRELAVHVPVFWSVRAGPSVDLAFFAGPTIFQVNQEVVTGVAFTQQHPFDAVNLTRVQRASHSGTSTGFHAGAEVAYFILDLGWRGGQGPVQSGHAGTGLGGSHRGRRSPRHGGPAAAVLTLRPRRPAGCGWSRAARDAGRIGSVRGLLTFLTAGGQRATMEVRDGPVPKVLLAAPR